MMPTLLDSNTLLHMVDSLDLFHFVMSIDHLDIVLDFLKPHHSMTLLDRLYILMPLRVKKILVYMLLVFLLDHHSTILLDIVYKMLIRFQSKFPMHKQLVQNLYEKDMQTLLDMRNIQWILVQKRTLQHNPLVVLSNCFQHMFLLLTYNIFLHHMDHNVLHQELKLYHLDIPLVLHLDYCKSDLLDKLCNYLLQNSNIFLVDMVLAWSSYMQTLVDNPNTWCIPMVNIGLILLWYYMVLHLYHYNLNLLDIDYMSHHLLLRRILMGMILVVLLVPYSIFLLDMVYILLILLDCMCHLDTCLDSSILFRLTLLVLHHIVLVSLSRSIHLDRLRHFLHLGNSILLDMDHIYHYLLPFLVYIVYIVMHFPLIFVLLDNLLMLFLCMIVLLNMDHILIDLILLEFLLDILHMHGVPLVSILLLNMLLVPIFY
mmetsp:Transcript_13452/g.20358  ORF Transcript_13452/g.20358 Transcript_13452/m.20358 type:complete len:428 (-) Transcript_13452:866-2149(-)